MVPLITRVQWGAKPPLRPLTVVPWSKRVGVTVHYTQSSRHATPLDLQEYAQNSLGYADGHYNLLVDFHGVAYEGRGWTVSAAHSEGENTTHIGIAFIGQDADVTTAAEATITALIQDANVLAGRILPELKGHQEMPDANTSCPGLRLMTLVWRLREQGGNMPTADDVYHILVEGERAGFPPSSQTSSETLDGTQVSLSNITMLRDTQRALFFARRAVEHIGQLKEQIAALQQTVATLASGGVDVDALADKVAGRIGDREATADRARADVLDGD